MPKMFFGKVKYIAKLKVIKRWRRTELSSTVKWDFSKDGIQNNQMDKKLKWNNYWRQNIGKLWEEVMCNMIKDAAIMMI